MLPRVAGVLIPLFSLSTLDDLGRGEILGLIPMIDFAREMGLGLIQLLPLNEGAPDETSPYSAMSVFAIDPVLLSMRGLKSIGPATLGKARNFAATKTGPPRTRVRAVKLPLLDRAWRAAREGAAKNEEFAHFIAQNQHWLPDYALFRALKDRFKWTAWEEWPAELRSRDAAALAVARQELADSIARYSWFQFLAHRQWQAVRAYAANRKVLIGGDMAFSPSHDSAEVWANQHLFDLDRTVGTPPDTFNEKGQRWGLPLPRWDAMREDGFKLWRARVSQAAMMFDLLRVDHVVGLYRTFSFDKHPEDPGEFIPPEESAQLTQGGEILEVLKQAAAKCDLIAEDLGTVPPPVRASLTGMGIPGYKVMQWERTGWDTVDERFLRPDEYPELALATTGTHDTEPLVSYWLDQSRTERAKLVEALDASSKIFSDLPLDEAGLDVIINALYASPARLVVLPIQDFFGWEEQINYPGTVSENNWAYRLPFAIENHADTLGIRSRIEKLCAIARENRRL